MKRNVLPGVVVLALLSMEPRLTAAVVLVPEFKELVQEAQQILLTDVISSRACNRGLGRRV